MTTPQLSICIPTWNRAAMLDHTLGRLQELNRFQVPFEIVVADNGSKDDTPQVIDKYRNTFNLKLCVQRQEVRPFVGMSNAFRNATGKSLVYLADDDSLIPEALFQYVSRMEREPDLAAIYTDWIAYDDEQEREIHRYFQFQDPVNFGPQDPLGLINFVFQYVIYPEMAVYRRDAMVRCDSLIKRGSMPFHMWMYRLSRMGRLAFEREPFYREHRVVKPWLRRQTTSNMNLRMELVGDELRNVLETMTLWAFQDAGMPGVPEHQALVVRRMIERFLHLRLNLEIQRALGEKNWIQALEFRRRLTLWNGPGTPDEQRRDAELIAIPAAFQAIREMYYNLSDVSGVLFVDFKGPTVPNFFRTHYPEIPLLEPSSPNLGKPLVVFKRDQGPADNSYGAPPGYCLYMDRLFDMYRAAVVQIDLSEL